MHALLRNMFPISQPEYTCKYLVGIKQTSLHETVHLSIQEIMLKLADGSENSQTLCL